MSLKGETKVLSVSVYVPPTSGVRVSTGPYHFSPDLTPTLLGGVTGGGLVVGEKEDSTGPFTEEE